MEPKRIIRLSAVLFFMALMNISCDFQKEVDSSSALEMSSNVVDIPNSVKIEKVSRFLVVQCSNGYDYGTSGYDFDPLLEKELDKIESIEVIPFPYKKLMNVPSQGVFDKKYCKPILEKVDVDYLIMTRFVGEYSSIIMNGGTWGYETKILNTTTMKQVNSIGKKGLESYQEIEQDIQRNIKRILSDLERTK